MTLEEYCIKNEFTPSGFWGSGFAHDNPVYETGRGFLTSFKDLRVKVYLSQTDPETDYNLKERDLFCVLVVVRDMVERCERNSKAVLSIELLAGVAHDVVEATASEMLLKIEGEVLKEKENEFNR